MKYLHILMHCASEPIAMQHEKLVDIVSFLKFKATGGMLDDQEIAARITKTQEKSVARSEGQVGVLPVYGIIAQRISTMEQISGGGGTSTEQIAAGFRAMLDDDMIKAIILDIHSPGGTVFGVEDLGNEIYESRGKKPIIAQVNSLAASAAYWIASQADEVVVTPGGQAGSIGVYTIHEDISAFLEKEGIKETIISAGENKVLGNEFEPLSERAREVMQGRVDECYGAFVSNVARGRGVNRKTVNEQFGQGLCFGGEQLVKRGMADRVAGMAQTLERFGVQLNAHASRTRSMSAQQFARAEATDLMMKKLLAGDRPTIREAENAFKGLGLSNSEAERAVAVLFKDAAHGDHDANQTDSSVGDALAELRANISNFKLPTL